MRTVILGLALSSTALAVPVELAHQARLLDPSGGPIEGEHDVTVSIYTSATGPTASWSETWTVPFSDGYVSLELGTQTGNPLDHTVFDGEAWLGLSVDGGSELPRQRVRQTPRAAFATVSENVSGGIVDASEIRVGGQTIIDGSGAWAGGGSGPVGYPTNPLMVAEVDPYLCRSTHNEVAAMIVFPTVFPTTPAVITAIDESIDNSGASYTRLQWAAENRVALDCNARSDALHWLALEPGAWTIDGKAVEAGIVASVSDNATIYFTPGHFSTTPVIFLQPGGGSARARIINTPATGGFQVEVATNNTPLHWMAFEAGTYDHGRYHFEVGRVSQPDNGDTFSFQETFDQLPQVMMQIHDTNNSGASYVRTREIHHDSFRIYVNDNGSEYLNYMALVDDR